MKRIWEANRQREKEQHATDVDNKDTWHEIAK